MDAVTQRGAPPGVGGVRSLELKQETGQLSSLGPGGYRGRKDGWGFGVCSKKKSLTVPQISDFRQGTGSCGSLGLLKASLERPAANFLGQVAGFFFPLPNFPLLKIFQAFSAEGAFALLT